MSIEGKRGCGYREIGGLYLRCDGMGFGCDRLPLPLECCPTCNAGFKFSRAPVKVKTEALFGIHAECKDLGPRCPVCQPSDLICEFGSNEPIKNASHYLMGVGKQSYTTLSFILEAAELGVSKRIAAIPVGLVLGRSWVFLTHQEAIMTLDADGQPNYKLGVFYAFKPSRIEMLIKESTPVEEAAELIKRGITPVLVPDNDTDHWPKKWKKAIKDAENVEPPADNALLNSLALATAPLEIPGSATEEAMQ